MKMANNQEQQTQIIPIEISCIVTQRNDLPCIELRKVTTNIDLIKLLISCAFHGKPIMIIPKFQDKMRSLGSLCEKGLIYREQNQYYFTI